MKETDRKIDGVTSRRTFLKTLAATGGGIAALVASGQAAADVEVPTPDAAKEESSMHSSRRSSAFSTG